MLNSADILTYIDTFYGFGNFNADYWFIGIEEGGGGSEQEVQNRIDSWIALGRTNLLDNQIHHHNIGLGKFFTDDNALQKTWDKLIVVYATLTGNDPNSTVLRKAIQRMDWGGMASNNALIEFFPLPSPNANNWNYGDWSTIPFLKSRDIYKAHVANARMTFFRDKIKLHRPRMVFMYGGGLKHYWNSLPLPIINAWHMVKTRNNYWEYFLQNGTLYVVTPHPTGVYANDFWIQVANRIAMELPPLPML